MSESPLSSIYGPHGPSNYGQSSQMVATGFYHPSTPYNLANPATSWAIPSTPIAGVSQPFQAPVVPPSPTPGPSGSAPSSNKKNNAKFSDKDRQVMGEMLLHDKNTSNTQGGHKAEVWQAIADALNVQRVLGAPKTVKNCRSALNYTYTNYWEPINTLLTQTSGFGWDPEKKCVTAPEQVWTDYIKSHPWAANWKDKSWDLFELYNSYFEGSRAHGRNVVRPGQDSRAAETRPSRGDLGEEEELIDDDDSTVPETQSTVSRTSSRSRESQGQLATKRKAPSTAESAVLIASSMDRWVEMENRKLEKKGRVRVTAEDRLREAINHITNLDYLDHGDQVTLINLLCEQPRKVEGLLSVRGMAIETDMLQSWLGY